MSSSNLLNRQIMRSYSRHKTSLNTPVPEDPAPSTFATTVDTPEPSGAEVPASSSAAGTSSPTPKRKLRAPADQDSAVSKRSRSALGPSRKGKEKHVAPTARLSDLGGVKSVIEQLLEHVALPICHPEIYDVIGIRPSRGVLLCGPPGCGKTMLANALAGELGVPFISISAPSVVSGMSGESEKAVRDTFEEAAKLAPCLLFIDEIDAITPKRETAQREMERRIVAQLLTCLDDLSWDRTDGKPVIVIGATNRPDSLDPALRRGGRFDQEISMGVPDEGAREAILRVLCSKLRIAGDFDFKSLARATPGYVGADLNALTAAAGVIAVKRIFEQAGSLFPPSIVPPSTLPEIDGMVLDDVRAAGSALQASLNGATDGPPSSGAVTPAAAPFENLSPDLLQIPIASFLHLHPRPLPESQLSSLSIATSDFSLALAQVQPSSKREGFTTVPDVTWDQVGALRETRDELRMAIVQPIRRPEVFAQLGIESPCGVLLWGPPGCGKTLLAKAVANESRANFISVKGPELLNKYVGESERAVRQVFTRARASSPCIIFFDELDALVPRRDDSLSESSARVVNTLLTELDGLEPRKQVFVVGATNRPDMIDPAMVRPGRLDKMLFVDLPGPEERVEILKALARRTPLAADVDLAAIAQDARCDGFSGADLSALIREAAVTSLREVFATLSDEASAVPAEPATAAPHVNMRHFDVALAKVSPSVSLAQRKRYAALRNRFAGLPFGKEGAANAAPTSA